MVLDEGRQDGSECRERKWGWTSGRSLRERKVRSGFVPPALGRRMEEWFRTTEVGPHGLGEGT